MPGIHTRIAPTPSGLLHIGNAFNFLLTEHLAKERGATLRLRIDDLDALRKRPEYITDIFESLRWLSIEPDEGPQNPVDQELHFSQRLRLPVYDRMLQRLADTGLVFACTCSRKDLERSGTGQYAGTCIRKDIPLDTPDVAWRIQTPQQDAAIHFCDRILGDQRFDLREVQRHFIVRRRDGLPAYHVASLCDDADYRINLIVRGADLLTSTAAQLYLARLLKLEHFYGSAFYHHPLLTDAHGVKLSKSTGSTSLKALREMGLSPDKLRNNAREWWQLFL